MSYGINNAEPRRLLKCEMCHVTGTTEVYTWGSFEILPKHPYYEMKICKKCAKREYGTKNKVKFDDYIERRMYAKEKQVD
tara:strand:- start:4512 stop:4751 length:240 start_codon:yes stop_codon:yes gene_type:complete